MILFQKGIISQTRSNARAPGPLKVTQRRQAFWQIGNSFFKFHKEKPPFKFAGPLDRSATFFLFN
ncbi:hypothetical protein [Commensalibacter oyaizuii]|uniref:Uncharacterized protein n=1 Tax=Commensalibacter oyaizuii TaxID=3043873 RepID=A0ABT6Q2M1_9PROT|nr:hypothetical protein [Commensalibacter sp. TBRC 16381]MDI2091344.1 hypothetical protein [Commensalibacter sp. TBRC 16381]